MSDYPEDVTFTESCGCVFCDLDLKPEGRHGTELVHLTKRAPGWVKCTRSDGVRVAAAIRGDGQ